MTHSHKIACFRRTYIAVFVFSLFRLSDSAVNMPFVYFGPMDKMRIEETLSLHCKGQLAHGKLEDALSETKMTPEEYNDHILDTFERLGEEKRPALLTESLVDHTMRKDLINKNTQKSIGNEFGKTVRRTLEQFYRIDMCPSLVLHDSLLTTDDYRFLLEIYSDFYNLNHEYTDEMAAYLDTIVSSYIKSIASKCGDEISVDKLKKLVKN